MHPKVQLRGRPVPPVPCKPPALQAQWERTQCSTSGWAAAQQLPPQASPEQTPGSSSIACTGQDSPPRISPFGAARAARSAYLGLCSAGERYLRVNLKEMQGRTGEHAFAACLQTLGFPPCAQLSLPMWHLVRNPSNLPEVCKTKLATDIFPPR